MLRPHSYANLDKDTMLEVEVKVPMPMRTLAEQIVSMNYGVHRLLSHLVDVRRDRIRQAIGTFRERGDHDAAKAVEAHGDRLADGISSAVSIDRRGRY